MHDQESELGFTRKGLIVITKTGRTRQAGSKPGRQSGGKGTDRGKARLRKQAGRIRVEHGKAVQMQRYRQGKGKAQESGRQDRSQAGRQADRR